ncbi:hypothetical protein [Rhodococcus opacus]|uniref:hypothetical protein n=1 Tax=Rhodococcus opacus TaxID=37919 RepID=UPI00155AF205|nr:hypothetical protein [Rhodococcus opacus]
MEFFPNDKPLKLAPQQNGPLWDLTVPVGAEDKFLRVIALWTDNTALERAAPTVQLQLKAPGGILTTVTAGDGPVAVIGQNGIRGVAECTRLPRDVYLVAITEISEQNTGRNWVFRIKNNSDQSLRFVAVVANKAVDTVKPWLVLGEDRAAIPPSVSVEISIETEGEYLTVQNWGTGTASIFDELGPIGDLQSPANLVHCPETVEIHGVDHMAIRAVSNASPTELIHSLDTNDHVHESIVRVLIR